MTTTTSATRIRHDSDATFREWVAEMTAKLAACGLVQTADTGQIDPVTVLRPAINTSGGYQIWRFNDTLQATAPVFIKIEYRTGGAATIPVTFFGVGTSTNGAGTLTGINYVPQIIASQNIAQITDTARNSYWCHTAGFLGISWKVGSGGTEAIFTLSRSVNPTTGAATADGLLMMSLGANFVSGRFFKFTATALVSPLNNNTVDMGPCHWPFSQLTSLVGLDPQVALAFIPIPRVTPVIGVVGCRPTEFAPFNTFSFTPVGSTSHNYLALQDFNFMSSNSMLKPAILWE